MGVGSAFLPILGQQFPTVQQVSISSQSNSGSAISQLYGRSAFLPSPPGVEMEV